MVQAERDPAGFLKDDPLEAVEFSVRSSQTEQTVLRRSRGRRRMAFFALAAAWGFLSGSSAVLVGLTLLGRPAYLARPLALSLGVAALAALAGGMVVAAAYRENTRRLK